MNVSKCMQLVPVLAMMCAALQASAQTHDVRLDEARIVAALALPPALADSLDGQAVRASLEIDSAGRVVKLSAWGLDADDRLKRTNVLDGLTMKVVAEPASNNGCPVPSEATIRVAFSAEGAGEHRRVRASVVSSDIVPNPWLLIYPASCLGWLQSTAAGGNGKLPDPDEFVSIDEDPKYDELDLQRAVRYPELARRNGIEGKVVVRMLIDSEGKVVAGQIDHSDNPIFEYSSIAAVARVHFQPARRAGKGVAVWIQIPISYRLN